MHAADRGKRPKVASGQTARRSDFLEITDAVPARESVRSGPQPEGLHRESARALGTEPVAASELTVASSAMTQCPRVACLQSEKWRNMSAVRVSVGELTRRERTSTRKHECITACVSIQQGVTNSKEWQRDAWYQRVDSLVRVAAEGRNEGG